MPNKFEVVINKFIDKYGKVVQASPDEIVKYLNKKNKNHYKKSIDFKKYLDKKPVEKNIIYNFLPHLFWDLFYKGENSVSLKKNDVMIGPMVAKIKNESIPVTIYLDSKKNIKASETYVFAFYNKNKKTFMWTYPDTVKDICSISLFKNFSVCNANMFKNVEPFEADRLALWFRASIYLEKNLLEFNRFNKMKTTNLILFEHEIDKDPIVVYTLIDYEIKDPKFNSKMSAKIDLLKAMTTVASNINNSMKGIKMYKGALK
jgi:hypothetical protein